MALKYKNNANALLVNPVSAGDTSLVIETAKADRFPAANTGTNAVNTAGMDWFKVVLEDALYNREICYVRTRALGSGILSNVLRGQEGSTALSFAAGVVVANRMTAQDLEAVAVLGGVTTVPELQTLLDVPTRTGANASGNWGIDISGRAAQATTADIATTATTATKGLVAAATGSADAISATFAPNVTALVNGLRVRITGLSPNTVTNPTLAAGTTATTPILGPQGFPLMRGDIQPESEFVYSTAAAAWLLQTVIPDRDAFSTTVTVSGNALSISADKSTTTFRDVSSTSGAPVRVTNASPIGLVVPYTATLGMTNGVEAKLAILEINAGGVKEIAIRNLAGGSLDESELISTTAISIGANSASAVYSNTARTNVAFRVRDIMTLTEAVAGTYATAPTKVQPIFGLALFEAAGVKTVNGASGDVVIAVPAPDPANISVPFAVSLGILGIPSTARRITVAYDGVGSISGGSIRLQPGNASGSQASGYILQSGSTTLIPLGASGTTQATGVRGVTVLYRMANGYWAIDSKTMDQTAGTNDAGTVQMAGAGDITTLLLTCTISNTPFGNVNVRWEL